MKTIDLTTGTLLVISEDDPFVVDDPYSYRLLGHPSEITGEVWEKVCEVVGGWETVLYYDYVKPCSDYRDIVEAAHKDPLLSGLSLIAAHNIKESDVLLFKPKNKEG